MSQELQCNLFKPELNHSDKIFNNTFTCDNYVFSIQSGQNLENGFRIFECSVNYLEYFVYTFIIKVIWFK